MHERFTEGQYRDLGPSDDETLTDELDAHGLAEQPVVDREQAAVEADERVGAALRAVEAAGRGSASEEDGIGY